MANDKKTNVTKQAKKQVANPTGESGSPPSLDTPGFGWTRYSEQVNGRFAMIGFIARLILRLSREKLQRGDFGLGLDGDRLSSIEAGF